MKKRILISFVLLSIYSTMQSAESPNKRMKTPSVKAQEAAESKEVLRTVIAAERKNKRKSRARSNSNLSMQSSSSSLGFTGLSIKEGDNREDNTSMMSYLSPDLQDAVHSPTVDQLDASLTFSDAFDVGLKCPRCTLPTCFTTEAAFRAHMFNHLLK